MSNVSAFSSTTSSVDQLVAQYMAIERKPINTLTQAKSDLTVRSAMFNDLNTSLAALRAKADALRKTFAESAFGGYTATSSNTTALAASATSSAAAASYTLSVSRLASFDTMVSSQFSSNGTEISTAFGGKEQVFDVTIGSTTKTIKFTPEAAATNAAVLTSLATALNNAGLNANASVVSESDGKSRLTVVSKTSGSANAVNFSASLDGQADGGLAGVTRSLKSLWAGVDTAPELTDGESYTVRFLNKDVAAGTIQIALYDSSDVEQSFLSNGTSVQLATISIPADGKKTTLNLGVGATLEIDDTITDGSYSFTYQKANAFLDNGSGGLDLLPDGASSGTTGGYLMERNQLDAQFKLNGLQFTRSSNSVTDAIKGVTLNLKQTTSSDLSLDVQPDLTSAKTKIQDFLTQTNTVLKWLQTKTAVDSTTYVRGALAGDVTYVGLRNTLRYSLQNRVTGLAAGADSTLSQIGIGFNDAGELAIVDETKLTNKMTANMQAVADIFARTATRTVTNADGSTETVTDNYGVAAKIYAEVNKFVKDKGILPTTKSNISNQMSSIDKRIKALEENMKRREAQIRSQLERQLEAMSIINAQQNTVTTMLSYYSSSTSSY